MQVHDNGVATAEPVAIEAVAAEPVAVPTSPSVEKVKKKVATKAKKKVTKPGMSDDEFHKELLDTLYTLRSETEFWVKIRNHSKNGEKLHKLLSKQPVYKWRLVGLSYYLEAKHTGDDKVVAFILPYNPRAEYDQKMRDYKSALDRATKRSKVPEKPEKPSDMKPCFQYHIAARKGDDTEGTCLKFDEAVQAVMSRKHLFIV